MAELPNRKPISNGVHTETMLPGEDYNEQTPLLSKKPKQERSTHKSSNAKFPRISRPVELLRPEYDVVIVGSGYGGGVAASRMARGAQSVCVLERGKERWPGEYPSSLAEAVPQLHFSGEFSPYGKLKKMIPEGDPTGLYHLMVGDGQNALVANGLGGTSLLNANVFLRADPGTLGMEKYWPSEICKPGSLEKYYQRAEQMLQPTPYPEEYPELPKLTLLEKQAEILGLSENFYRVPQTTRFEEGPNSSGVEMHRSTLTGMDTTGVNDGSKSSTLVNYLSDAWNWGAEIFCECEVRYVKKRPHGDGYNIFFAWHGSKRGKYKQDIYEDLMWVHAKKLVFLGAGTLGTTEILLRSKQVGLPISPRIGQHMSGNGDILAFGYNMNDEVNAIGRPSPNPARPIGPTITGVIDCRNQQNPLDGFVIEEGAVPQVLSGILQEMLKSMPGKVHPGDLSLVQTLQKRLASVASIVTPYNSKGSIEKTQIYLIMSHDSNQATMVLKDDKPVLTFLGVGNSTHVEKLNSLLERATTLAGGTFVNNPFFAAFGHQEITVHPIGGANFSSDGTAENGVTTQCGEVLTGYESEFHDGLIVVDGALVPTALGVNPFATITALAERSVEKAAEKKSIMINYDTRNGILDPLFGNPAYPYPFPRKAGAFDAFKATQRLIDDAEAAESEGFEFSEVMSGYIHIGNDIDDFECARRAARGACEAARFFLSMHTWDIETMVNRSDHSGTLTGTFTSACLKASPYLVLQGKFQLMSDDQHRSDTKNLIYDFDMVGTDGSKLHFHGFKIIDFATIFSPHLLWTASATLYSTITHLDGSLVGRGIIEVELLGPSGFTTEVDSFTPSGNSLFAKVSSSTRYVTYFARQLATIFIGPLNFLQWPSPGFRGYKNKQTPLPFLLVAPQDGVKTKLHRWEPSPTAHCHSSIPILFIPGVGMDYQTFALPTLKQNAVEYFQAAGYRVYCVSHRIGNTVATENAYTTYDVRLDIFAALEKIREQLKSEKVYVIAHGEGAIALSMGLLDGTIPRDWIKGITASQVFMHPKLAEVNMWKATKLPSSLATMYRLLVGNWFSCTSTKSDSLVQKLLDQVLRFYPVGEWKETCNHVVCHRTELVFGRLFAHANINQDTHDQLQNFIGGVSLSCLTHLIAMGVSGQPLIPDSASSISTSSSSTTTTKASSQNLLSNPSNLDRLRGIPIFLFSGSETAVYSPEATEASYELLQDQLGPDDYERSVFRGRGYADVWMGEEGDFRDGNDDDEVDGDGDRVWEEVRKRIDSVCRPVER